MMRFDGKAIEPLELELLGGDPAESWIDTENMPEPQSRILWITPSVALGFIPSRNVRQQFRGEQPWQHAESGFAITADAQLTNRQELFSALNLEASSCDQMHDGQLILLAWLRWGELSLDHLQGDFTFALWDPFRQSLICVRDRLGARAQGFITHQNYFAFASDSEWLVRLPGMTGRPNLTGVAELIDWRFPMLGERSTWREEVQTLLPGESLAAKGDGSMRFRTWWEVGALATECYTSDDDVVQRFLEVFAASVKSRMDRQDAASVLLSGGLDSLAVACVAKSLLPPEAHISSYSGVYDGDEKCIESESIFSLITSLQAEAEVIRSSSIIGSLRKDDLFHIAWSRPHPMESSLLVPALCCLSARRAGATTLLHGVSGDVVTAAPLLYMSEYFRRFQWRFALRECISASRNNVYLRNRGLGWITGRALLHATLPAPTRNFLRRSWQVVTHEDRPSHLLHPDAWRAYMREKAERTSVALPSKSFSVPGMASLVSGLAGFGRLGRRFSQSMRDPWADVDVLRFFLGLPLHHRVRQGWTKYPVRQAFRGSVDPEVLWRRDKQHVGWRFTQQLMLASDDYVRDTLNGGLGDIADFVNVAAVRKLMSQYHPAKSTESIDLVRGLVTLVLWMRR